MRTGTWSGMGSVSVVPLPRCSGRSTLGWRCLVGMQISSAIEIYLWTLSEASACICRPRGSCFSLFHTSVRETLEDSLIVCGGDHKKGCAICIGRSCGCASVGAGCLVRSRRIVRICPENASPSTSSGLVSSGHPGQTGFQSAGHTPISCPGCGEHLLHHAHPQICWVVKGLVFSHFWKGHTNSNECFFFPLSGR